MERRLGMDGRVKQRQEFYPGDSQRSVILTYCSLLRNFWLTAPTVQTQIDGGIVL